MFHIFHNWEYTPAVYENEQMERLAIPEKPAIRKCTKCNKIEREVKHCLGLNPPEYNSMWLTTP